MLRETSLPGGVACPRPGTAVLLVDLLAGGDSDGWGVLLTEWVVDSVNMGQRNTVGTMGMFWDSVFVGSGGGGKLYQLIPGALPLPVRTWGGCGSCDNCLGVFCRCLGTV